MALDSLPGELIVPTRDQVRDQYLAAFRLRNPAALTTENTFPWIDACCVADAVQLVFRDAVVANNGVTILTCTGAAVDQRLKELGLARLPAIGGSGYVIVGASGGGSTIQAGDEIKDINTGIRFKCTTTALYQNGDLLPIVGIDLGEQTNLDGGSVLTWTAPRPGSLSTAVVFTLADGVSGITGGHGLEDDESAIARAISVRANPPASGNDAEYQLAIVSTPGIAVEQGFTHPAILGAGTIGFAFTIRPSVPGATRIPNGAQVTAVNTYVTSLMPGDDMIFACTITAQPVNVALRLVWSRGALTWVDTAPWPAYAAIAGQAVIVSSASGALNFILRTANNVYTGLTQPKVGNTIAFYDKAAQLFRRKRLLSVAGTGPWTIACDTAGAASDTTYTPVVGTRASPWSESLNDVPPAVVEYFDGLGPGEQVATFFDAGNGQRRSPESPAFFESKVSNRLVIPLLAVQSVQDAVVAEPAVPFATTVGTPGINSNLLTLSDLAAFPQ